MRDDFKPEQIAEQVKIFANTPFGKYFLELFTDQYESLHRQAEMSGLSMESKAMLVERAAGVRNVVRFFTDRLPD